MNTRAKRIGLFVLGAMVGAGVLWAFLSPTVRLFSRWQLLGQHSGSTPILVGDPGCDPAFLLIALERSSHGVEWKLATGSKTITASKEETIRALRKVAKVSPSVTVAIGGDSGVSVADLKRAMSELNELGFNRFFVAEDMEQ